MNTKLLALSNGEFAIVEEKHHTYLSQFKWHVSSSKTIQYSYKRGHRKTRNVSLASAVMGNPRGQYDHIDGNKYNNVRSNLRPCTKSLNEANKPKMSKKTSSQYKGVFFDKARNKWSAQCAKDGVKYCLGRFDNEEAAAKAYDAKAKELFGCFALVNFNEDGTRIANKSVASSGNLSTA